MAFPQSGSSSTVSRSNLNLEVLIFEEGGKPENPEKNPRSKDKNLQQTQPTYNAWSEASALTTAPSLLHYHKIIKFDLLSTRSENALWNIKESRKELTLKTCFKLSLFPRYTLVDLKLGGAGCIY